MLNQTMNPKQTHLQKMGPRTHITSPPNLVKSFGFLRRGHAEPVKRSTQLGILYPKTKEEENQPLLFVHQKLHGRRTPKLNQNPIAKDDPRNQKLPLLGSDWLFFPCQRRETKLRAHTRINLRERERGVRRFFDQRPAQPLCSPKENFQVLKDGVTQEDKDSSLFSLLSEMACWHWCVRRMFQFVAAFAHDAPKILCRLEIERANKIMGNSNFVALNFAASSFVWFPIMKRAVTFPRSILSLLSFLSISTGHIHMRKKIASLTMNW